MVTESGANDELTGMLRSLSLKRRQGILEVMGEEGTLELTFQNGKIVDAQAAGSKPAKQVCTRLIGAGLLMEDLLQKLTKVDLNIEQLHSLLVGKKFVSHENFLRAKNSHQLDLLHSLRKFEDMSLDFKPKIVNVDPELALGVSPGQLLLDLVELESEEERFLEIFGELDTATVLVSRADVKPKTRWGTEENVWALLEQPQTLSLLVSKLLMSAYELKQALLSLYDQRALVIDSGLADEPESNDDIIEEAARLLSTPVESSDLDECTYDPDSGVEEPLPEVFEQALELPVATPSQGQEREIVERSLFAMNYALLEGMERAGIMMSLIFLFVLALVLPGQLNEWFQALGDFSSLYLNLHDRLPLK